MEISIKKTPDFSVVNVSGQIDAVTCSDLEDSLLNLIDDNEMKIIINMSGCNYISSAGLRVLLATNKQLYGTGAFALCSLGDDVSDIFDMVGFSTLINIYDDLESAGKGILEGCQ